MFNGVLKGVKDPIVKQMVDEATKVLEAIANELWLLWVEHLVPNVACRVRAEVEARAQEEHDCELREEAKRLVDKKLARAVQRDKRLEEKLMEVLEGRLSQVALVVDLEVEEMGEAEGSKAVGTEDIGTTGGTQSSVMEVDEEEEDEVVVVEEVKQSEMWKRAPSSPLKMSRKRVQAGMATQTLAGSQVLGSSVQGSQAGSGNAGSMGKLCWRCVKHQVQCIVATNRAQCKNCQVKHYGCSLVPLKESGGGRGGASGSQKAKVVEESQMKGWARKA